MARINPKPPTTYPRLMVGRTLEHRRQASAEARGTGLCSEMRRTTASPARSCSAIAPETEADPTAVLLSLLTAFGNAVGSGPQFNMLDGDHYANLFVGLVGGTASGKGRRARIVRRLMGSADPEWERGSIIMSLSSGEGFVERVKDDDLDEEQETFSFVVPEVKRLLIIESEFARTFGAMGRKENTLSGTIRSAWDHDVLEVNTRAKNRLRASNAHVSMIFHCTPEELSKLLSNSIEVVNGFSNRILWALVRRSNILPRGGRSDAVEPFGEPMKRAIAQARGIRSICWDEEAGALWDADYQALTEEKPGAYGAATQRAHAQTLRLSLLYALLDGSGLIRAEHLRAALAVWKYCEASAKRIFGGGEEQGQVLGGQSLATVPLPLHLRLLDIIAKSPGVSRRGLHQATGKPHQG